MMILYVLGIVVFMLLIAIPWLWGLADMYGCYRFARQKLVDYTAAIIHWWEIKGLFATQSEAMVEKFPWLAMDLSEDREVTDQDGKVT